MVNFDFFGMFDYLTGDDDTYKYSSTEFSTFISGLTGDGVSANYGGELEATVNGLNITIASGACFIGGRFAVNEDSKTITLSATQSGETKKYLLVADCDIVDRVIGLELVAATGSNFPTPIYTDNEKQIALYEITVSSGSNVSINDVRQFTYNATALRDILDDMASAITALTNQVVPVSKGGTGATTAAEALENLNIIYSATQPSVVNGGIWLKPLV